MAVEIRGERDDVIRQIEIVLEAYQKDHPLAQITMYRQNSVSVRIRIVDPDFNGMSKADRNDRVWDYLDRLSDNAQADVSVLLLLTPSELPKSFANLEFEDPVPSVL
jgi:stress-induced morphogen